MCGENLEKARIRLDNFLQDGEAAMVMRHACSALLALFFSVSFAVPPVAVPCGYLTRLLKKRYGGT